MTACVLRKTFGGAPTRQGPAAPGRNSSAAMNAARAARPTGTTHVPYASDSLSAGSHSRTKGLRSSSRLASAAASSDCAALCAARRCTSRSCCCHTSSVASTNPSDTCTPHSAAGAVEL